jgi:hypothetical protein
MQEEIDVGKAFSENEMGIIRRKLIESCQICWERHTIV